MKILFTGASSFTGCWFVRELAAAEHEVTMTFRGDAADYEGVRAERVKMAAERGEPLFGCSFGDERFLEAAQRRGGWDLLCHHAADVTDYKSPDFDIAAAVGNNTHNLRAVLEAMNCPVLLTGSVFEPNEGAGSEGLRAFSPYGLSKGLTAEVLRYYAEALDLPLGKFVIPNPFGPFEEPRFTNYLVKSWYAGRTPRVNTPAYVRDNIHVSLLAKAYADFAAILPSETGFIKLNPSGYVESQGAFAERFAREMDRRLEVDCAVELAEQAEFVEPRIRINTDPLDVAALGWHESAAWDDIAAFYEGVFAR